MVNQMRELIRRVSRNRILRKRLPAEFGRGVVYCSPEALLSMWKPGWQSQQVLDLMGWVTSGTHLGAPVRILPMAVGARNCLAEFVIARTDRALNHLSDAQGNPRTGGARDVVSVLCAPLDWLLDQLPAPDFLKIDVEGAELAVMEGGARLFMECRPLLIVETAPENGAAMAALLQRYGYVMFDAESDQGAALSVPAWNTLAVPAERSQAVLDSRRHVQDSP